MRHTLHPHTHINEKQCSRQLQCKVPCSLGNVINSSLFINSSWSCLSSTSHAVFGGGRSLAMGGGGFSHGGGGLAALGAGDILVQLPYTALPHGASP